MSQYSAALNDLVGDDRDWAPIFEGLSNLIGQINNLVRAISKPASLSRMDERGLVATANLLDLAASESSSRVNNSCDVIVSNAPERIPVNDLRAQLLVASRMSHITSLMMRLRKRIQSHSCPLMLQLKIKIPAKLFVSKQNVIAAATTSKNKNNDRQNTSPKGKCYPYFTQFQSQPFHFRGATSEQRTAIYSVANPKSLPIRSPNRNSLEPISSKGSRPAVVDTDITGLPSTFQPPSKRPGTERRPVPSGSIICPPCTNSAAWSSKPGPLFYRHIPARLHTLQVPK